MDENYSNVNKLEDMDIGQLRKFAAILHLNFPRDAKKADLIKLINDKKRGGDVAIISNVGDRPSPGWARIELHRSNVPGASNRPVFVGVNGYNITIPLGVEVDVPIKVVEALAVAKTTKLTTDDQGRHSYEHALSYPYSVKDINPGPDPRPMNELGRKTSYGPRVAFRDLFGRWPRKDELREAQKQGFIKLTPLENITMEATNSDANLPSTDE